MQRKKNSHKKTSNKNQLQTTRVRTRRQCESPPSRDVTSARHSFNALRPFINFARAISALRDIEPLSTLPLCIWYSFQSSDIRDACLICKWFVFFLISAKWFGTVYNYYDMRENDRRAASISAIRWAFKSLFVSKSPNTINSCFFLSGYPEFVIST